MLTKKQVVRDSHLTPLQQRLIFLDILECQVVPADASKLTGYAAFVFWVADFLEQLKFLQPSQRTLLLRELVPLLKAATLLAQPAPIYQLVFAEGRFATWTNQTGWLDLETGEHCQQTPVTALEIIAYNLTELYRRKRERCHKRPASSPG